jgi:ABC-type sulfate transport system permease subunit
MEVVLLPASNLWSHSFKEDLQAYLSILKIPGAVAAIRLWAIVSYRSVETPTIFTWKSSFLTMRTRFVRPVIRRIKGKLRLLLALI